MGNARWSDSDYASYSRTASAKTQDQLFTQRGMHADLDPAKIKVREAVDSEANPDSSPIIIACDVTGSMGFLAEEIVKRGLGKIMKAIYDHKPIPDPQIMLMATGDMNCDQAPLQITQFEASVDPLTKQIEQIFLEGGGGGNGGESYSAAWWFATYKTICDRITKRGKKGYLFTIGDERVHSEMKKDQVKRFFGVGCERDIPTVEMLKQTQKFWEVFHLIVQPVAGEPVVQSWKDLLNERAILVDDHKKLPETIVAIIRLIEGQQFTHDETTDNVARQLLLHA